MRKIVYFLVGLAIVLSPAVALADEAGDNGSGKDKVVTTGTERADEVRADKEEKNGEDEDGDDDKATATVKKVSPRSERALERMSEVAQKVQELLTTVGARGGIGDEVREVAREQNDEQKETRESLDEVDRRSGLLKALIGPNFKELGNIRAQIVRTENRIQKLNNLKEKFTGEAAIQKSIADAVTALDAQLKSLLDKVKAEEASFSLFGWFVKLFSRQ